MPRVEGIEEALERLGRLRQAPAAAETLAELRVALGNRSAHVVARAAQLAGELELEALTPDLVAAFERFLQNPVKSDPQCVAKTAAVEALQRLAASEPGVFLRGIAYVQLEPVWGGRADTAVGLRAASAFGLVAMGWRDALAPLAELLADPEPRARAAAARALAAREDPGGAPLLRLKALLGDDEPEVFSDCLAALLRIDPAEPIPFVARFLEHAREPTREAAALALGESRRPEALAPLRAAFESTADPDRRRTLLLAMAMLKNEEALRFLLALVADAPGPTARQAIEALAMHRYDGALAARVRAAARRDDADLAGALAEAFPPP